MTDDGKILRLRDSGLPFERGILSRHGRRGSAASDLYLTTVSQLEEIAKLADLGDPKEFHDLLWLAVALGGSQTDIAYEQAKAPSVVSLWVSRKQTPVPHRRHGILASALVSLRKSIADGLPVPLHDYNGRRSKRSLTPLDPQ